MVYLSTLVHNGVTLHVCTNLYFIQVHLDGIKSLIRHFNAPAFTQNLHHISYMREPLSSSCTVHAADGCIQLGAPSRIRSASCPAYLYAGHSCRLVLPMSKFRIFDFRFINFVRYLYIFIFILCFRIRRNCEVKQTDDDADKENKIECYKPQMSRHNTIGYFSFYLMPFL